MLLNSISWDNDKLRQQRKGCCDLILLHLRNIVYRDIGLWMPRRFAPSNCAHTRSGSVANTIALSERGGWVTIPIATQGLSQSIDHRRSRNTLIWPTTQSVFSTLAIALCIVPITLLFGRN